MAEVFCETGRPTCARCGHPRDEFRSTKLRPRLVHPGHGFDGCRQEDCSCASYRSGAQDDALADLDSVLRQFQAAEVPLGQLVVQWEHASRKIQAAFR